MLLHGKVVWLVCTIFLMAVLVPAFAQTESAAAGTPAVVSPACSTLHAGAIRSLSSVKKSTAQNYCDQARTHAYKVQFWLGESHNWTLYRHGVNSKLTCRQLRVRHRLRGPESLCVRARDEVRIHGQKLRSLNAKIEQLTTSGLWLTDLASTSSRRSCIANTETPGSSHPYTQQQLGGGDYWGKYQYDPGTWKKAREKASVFYHLALRVTDTAAQASPRDQDVVTAFAVAHPDLLGWDPWQECR